MEGAKDESRAAGSMGMCEDRREFKEPVQDPAPQVLGQPCNYIYQGMGMGLKTHCGVACSAENMEASLVFLCMLQKGRMHKLFKITRQRQKALQLPWSRPSLVKCVLY